MKHSNLYILLILIFLTGGTNTSCQNQTSQLEHNTVDSSIENIHAFREHFWKQLPKPNGYVNDYEKLYSDNEEKSLDSLIRAFGEKTSIQIAVITIDTLMTSRDSLDALTLLVGNTWGVGQKDKNNGIVVGISRGYRKMRIQNGYGIEKIISDEETKVIVDSSFIPYFREGRYFDGTFSGLSAVMETLQKKIKTNGY